MESTKSQLEGGPGEPKLKLVNRLGESRSPYVRGHASNPVAWQMWTPEALELAKQHNRLLFVSIGYAACHWCHVMERESFENREIANILNSSFIPIKIDREERPDIDRIYMNYIQATTGEGGWPLNVFLTPNLQPLFGGTYFLGPESATTNYGNMGFLEVLNKMKDVWKTQQEKCLQEASEITAQLQQFAQEGLISHQGDRGADSDSDLDLELLDEAMDHFTIKYDHRHGGFGTAPKFPTPVNLLFLLHLSKYPEQVQDVLGFNECEHAKTMVMDTLKAMAKGGIHDQIGNGFARYSVTPDWSLPHFEKMLYDQAQLLQVYLNAYLTSQDPKTLEIVHDIATYLTSPPMHSPNGGFFSAEDADSLYRSTDKVRREGAFYVWTTNELQTILGERDAGVLATYYNVRENGNVEPEHDAHDELINQNVLAISSDAQSLSTQFGIAVDEVEQIIKEGGEKLLEHRNKERPRPTLDDKIVVAWNGLAVGALARTSAVLEISEPQKAKTYLSAAIKTVDFIRKELFDEKSGTMKRVYREGPGDAPAFADDYAFLISGLIDLYETTLDDSYLQFADRLQKTQIDTFWDSKGGGFFSTASEAADLILRLKDGMDNAEPSTNGISASNLNRLGSMLFDTSYETLAKKTALAFEAEIMQHPFLFASLMDAVVVGNLGMEGIILAGDAQFIQSELDKLRKVVQPTRTIVAVGGKGKSEWLRERNALLKGLDMRKNRLQVCTHGVCREIDTLPVSETA